MNRLKIIGIVAAFHATLFLFIFAIPGCRSTGKTTAGETVPAAPVTPPPPATFDPFAPAAGPRVTPVRPGSAAAISLAPPPPIVSVAPPPSPAAATSYTVKSGDNLWNLHQKYGVTINALAQANNIAADAMLHPGQKLLIPSAPAKGTAVVVSTDAGTNNYVVKSGDTLKTIATRNHTTPEAIKALNNLRSDTVRANQTLKLPVVAPSAATLAPAIPATDGLIHTVKPGDTLGAIARKYNVKQADLEVANSIRDPGKKLVIGQELKIPVKGPGKAPVADTSVVPAPPPPVSNSRPALDLILPPVGPSPAATPAEVSPISPAPPPPAGPVIKIEGDGAPRIP